MHIWKLSAIGGWTWQSKPPGESVHVCEYGHARIWVWLKSMVCNKKTSKLLFSVETDNIWVVNMGMMLFYNGNYVLYIQGAAAFIVVEPESAKHLERRYLILGYIHKLRDGLKRTIMSSLACSNTWLEVLKRSLKQSKIIGCLDFGDQNLYYHVPYWGSWSSTAELDIMGVAGRQPIHCWLGWCIFY